MSWEEISHTLISFWVFANVQPVLDVCDKKVEQNGLRRAAPVFPRAHGKNLEALALRSIVENTKDVCQCVHLPPLVANV